ncbi:MAG: hypothetical protein JXR83_06140 [Deltaproteobacteria bacterium]|nr:hypothetical protein [Deltaproteobacteria bacterium]
MARDIFDLAAMRGEVRRRLAALRIVGGELYGSLRVEAQDAWRDARGESARAHERLRTWLDEPRSLAERAGDVRETVSRSTDAAGRRTRWARERALDLSRVSAASIRLKSMHDAQNLRQAYAPFFMAFHEAQAGAVLARLSDDKRRSLVPLAEHIRDAQLKMTERTRGYDDCGRCPRTGDTGSGGGCCSSSVGQMFRPIDGVYRRLLDERAPIWPHFVDDWTRCGYLGAAGCILPAGTRPLVCVGFYCNEWRERLDRDGVWGPMSAEFQQIRQAVRELEFRFNMHRRFVLRPSHTIRDGTMGYLWSKLLALYSSYDQIAPARRTAGVDAVAGTEVVAEAPAPAAATAGASDA